jgi:hypothetical protein
MLWRFEQNAGILRSAQNDKTLFQNANVQDDNIFAQNNKRSWLG